MVSRAEHRRGILTSLSDAAIDLFESVGPAVTMDAIAERAGVSRRTVFRYVDSKEDLAYIQPVLWLDVFEQGLASADEGADLAERLSVASFAIAHYIDADPHRPRRAFLVAGTNPELARGFSGIFQRWVDRVAVEVLAAGDPANPAHRFRSRIIASAVMGTVDAVTREWLFAPPKTTFAELYEKGFEILRPLLVLD